MLSLEIQDRLAYYLGEAAVLLSPGRGEQARHPFLLEPVDLAVQGALGSASLSRPLGRRLPEKNNRTAQLVEELLRESDQQIALLPVVCRRYSLASRFARS